MVLNNSDPAAVGGVDKLVPEMLFASMPEWMLGLIVVLVLSASMSTLQSLVMVSSSAIAIDLVKGVFNPNMSDKAVKGLMRGLCAAFVVVSLIIALGQVAEIVTLMSMSWGTVAGCILGPYLFGVVSKRTNKRGAICGFSAGLLLSIALTIALGTGQAPMIGCLSMLASVVVTPLVSLLAPAPDQALIACAFAKGK